ncbi:MULTISPECIES: hypothetical protein [Myroides]|uniref:Uncharacterized protein n=1 Tax=Myroides albus TaxID=2562892 RepID=A0A6I3LHP5_9FLAO|nr:MULTISPECIES: hypothetical protein [Myroides]MTG96670.1 hypothetical protein [Myroides albus]MVX34747.1 hypothetical protein [Myroides sp. LoEW2-1]UVD80918.1 hypothetical protein NWE55_06645 [Myroides albus]
MKKYIIKKIPLIALVLFLIFVLYPYRHFPMAFVNMISSSEMPLGKHIIAITSYDKLKGTVQDIKQNRREIEKHIGLLNEKGEYIKHKVDSNEYDFYKTGKQITYYQNPFSQETYVFDLETQIYLIIQIGFGLLVVFFLMSKLRKLLSTKFKFIYLLYIYLFKPLFYTPLAALIIYTNITLYQSVTEESIDYPLSIVIHILSGIALIIYLYDMIILLYYYTKTKNKRIINSLQ